MRVDPAHVLGIKPGEAVIVRNIGGRITPGLLEQLGLLGRIGQVTGEIPGGGGEFHLIVLQHTDCGITRLAGDPHCWRAIFKYRNRNSRLNQSPILARRLQSTSLRSGRFRHCRATGLFPASSMTWRPDLLKSSYRQRRFVLRKSQEIENYTMPVSQDRALVERKNGRRNSRRRSEFVKFSSLKKSTNDSVSKTI
jgi:hypothetical protein